MGLLEENIKRPFVWALRQSQSIRYSEFLTCHSGRPTMYIPAGKCTGDRNIQRVDAKLKLQWDYIERLAAVSIFHYGLSLIAGVKT
jgi:hypothetical protein